MADKTPTTALTPAPASTGKTALVTACDAFVTALEAARTEATSGNAQAWTLAVSGTPTGGTYTITLTDAVNGARTTSALAHNASSATVQTALRLLSGTGVSLTTVSEAGSTPNFTHTIQFKGIKNAITVTATSSLTGGTPVLTPTETSAYLALIKLGAQSLICIKNDFIRLLETLAGNLR